MVPYRRYLGRYLPTYLPTQVPTFVEVFPIPKLPQLTEGRQVGTYLGRQVPRQVPTWQVGRYLLWESGCALVLRHQFSSPHIQHLPPVGLKGFEHSNVQGLHEASGVFGKEYQPKTVCRSQLGRYLGTGRYSIATTYLVPTYIGTYQVGQVPTHRCQVPHQCFWC